MSLINDMLRDIDQRSAHPGAGAVIDGTVTVPRQTQRRLPRWLLPMAVALGLGGVGGYLLSGAGQARSQAAPVAPAPAPAPAPTPTPVAAATAAMPAAPAEPTAPATSTMVTATVATPKDPGAHDPTPPPAAFAVPPAARPVPTAADGARAVHTAPDKRVKLRRTPELDATVLRVLEPGTTLALLGEAQAYYRVRTADGVSGWISSEFARIAPPNMLDTATAATADVPTAAVANPARPAAPPPSPVARPAPPTPAPDTPPALATSAPPDASNSAAATKAPVTPAALDAPARHRSPPTAAAEAPPPAQAAPAAAETRPLQAVGQPPALHPVRATTAQAQHAEALRALARGQAEAAEAGLRRALAIDPTFAPALKALAALMIQHGRRAELEALLAELARRAHPDATAAVLLARLLAERGDNGGGLQLLEGLPPAALSGEQLAVLASLRQRLGRHDAAAAAYRQALAAGHRSGTTWAGLAVSLEVLGDHADARDAWRAALAAGALEPALARHARTRLAALGGTGDDLR